MMSDPSHRRRNNIHSTDIQRKKKEEEKRAKPKKAKEKGARPEKAKEKGARPKNVKEKPKAVEERENESLAYDAFRQVEANEEDEKIIEKYVLPICRLLMFFVLFAIILGSGTLMKLLFRSLIDTYSKVMTIGILHMLGVGVLIFNILPNLDAFRGNIILLNVAIVPSFLSFLMKFKFSKCVPKRRIVSLFIMCIALATQLGGAFVAHVYIITKDVISTDDIGILKLRIMYPITVFLISLEWWENFVSGKMRLFWRSDKLDLDKLRGHLEKTRIKASVAIIMTKLITIVCFALFLTQHDILDIKRTNIASPAVLLNSTASPFPNMTVVPTSMPIYDLSSATLESATNNITKVTEVCQTKVENNNTLLECSSNGTTIDLICIGGSTICSQMLSNETKDDVLFADHYFIVSETKSTVTFTNKTNNITCSKHFEPNDVIRLYCKSYGIDLQLLCKVGFIECERNYAEEKVTFITRIVDIWSENYIVLCTIFLSFVFSYASLLACKLHMQHFSFSLSIILISPITSILIYLNCRGIFTFNGIIPDVASCVPMGFESIKMSIIQGGVLWFGIVLLTYYIWIPRYERMAKMERLFVEPLKECFFSDINMLLRRKNNRTHRNNAKASNSNQDIKDKDIPRIKVCATMWHETKFEMHQLLKSLFRLDIYHAASVVAQEKSNYTDPDSFKLEIHIIFDDAFETVTKNGRKIRQPNSFVMQFIECIGKATRDIAQCDPSEWECIPQKKPTPFGAQLLFKMPGDTEMTVHLKDKSKIRHRKRWSQILYLYYLLGFKTFGMNKLNDILKKPANGSASLLSFLKPEYQMKNTFLLTLDGDVDFKPEAVLLLLDRMKKNPKTGAVCGRIHPIGSGPMVWYQQFEYAIGHWLQKAAEHVLGCVLCCPGCFSLFRASALMDDNVMNTYTTKPTEARHYIQYEQGEDRWLCTLLLQRGHKIDYEAGADALTYAPETFKDFFEQRRRWAPSTMANIMDLLGSWRNTVRVNDNISTLFIVYQFIVLISSLLAPATVTLMIAGSYSAVFNINATYSFYLSIAPIIIFIIICLKCESDTQLNVAALLSSIYAIIMVIVTVGTILNLVNDDFFSPTVLFLVGLGFIFTLAGLWHPKEFGCLLHGLLYYFTVPSTFILLTVYFLCNLNDVSWGTRDTKPVVEGTPTPMKALSFLSKVFNSIKCSCCGELVQPVSNEFQERFMKYKFAGKCESNTAVAIVRAEKKKEDNIDHAWINSAVLGRGKLITCSVEENEFWNEILRKYLHPLDNDRKQEEQIKQDLLSLRNNVVFAFFMLNFMFGVALLQLQLNREKILTFYILGKYEPVSVTLLAVFTIILVTQFIAMILHRWGTFLHLISNCKLNYMSEGERFEAHRNECVLLLNGKSRNLISKSTDSGLDNVPVPDYDSSTDSEENYEIGNHAKQRESGSHGQSIRGTFYDKRFQKNYSMAKRIVKHRHKRVMFIGDPTVEFYQPTRGRSNRRNPPYREYTAGERR